MPAVDRILAWEGLGFLILVFVGALVQSIKHGASASKGLLEGTTRNGVRFASPGRVQLLIASAGAAVPYISQLAKNPTVFPDVPNYLLLLFGGSHVIYLGGKYFSLRDRTR